MFSASRCVHVSFVVYQFGMAIRDGCEAMVHNIRGVLDVYLDWVMLQMDVVNVVNVFNFILHKAIFYFLGASSDRKPIVSTLPFCPFFYV